MPSVTSKLGGVAASVTFGENAVNVSPVSLDTDLAFAAGGSLTGSRLTVSGLLARDRIAFLAAGFGADGLPNDAGVRSAVDRLAGQITATGIGPDHEASASHAITVAVTDAAGASVSDTVVIRVTDVGEAPSALTPVSGGTVEENAAAGTPVAVVTGTDADAGDVLRYSLVGDAGGRFAIDAATGAIGVAAGAVLDFEAAASHAVTVEVTDAAGAAFRNSFAIRVADTNGAPTIPALQLGTRTPRDRPRDRRGGRPAARL